MIVALSDIGKRYNTEWIFRNVNARFSPEAPTAILGSNGSGKSTLLQIISGYYTPSEGSVSYQLNGAEVPTDEVFTHVALATPYLELYETQTFAEAVRFQAGFKPLADGLKAKDVVAISGLPANKPMKQFSSGMKQRARLSLAVLSSAKLLLLDEPTSNLDARGMEWYGKLLTDHLNHRTVIVCSNEQQAEYAFCTQELRLK